MFGPEEILFVLPEKGLLAHAEGLFAKKILVLAAPDTHLDFLQKVLGAAQIDLKNDALLARFPKGVGGSLLQETNVKQAKRIIVFGHSPTLLGLHIQAPAYKVFEFSGVQWLFADELAAIEPDQNRKKMLWAALKEMFGV